MISVDIKSLLSRLNTYCTRCLEASAGLCVSRTHYEVAVEHMLAKLLEDPQSDIPLILRHFDIDGGRVQKAIDQSLEEFKTGNAAKPVFSPLLMEWFQEAWLSSSVDLGENQVRSGALMLAFLSRSSQFATGGYVDLLSSISRDALKAQFWDILKNSSEKLSARLERAEEAAAPTEGTALAQFCVD
ncbi:MAG: type VI secretion system ATPase TssH, partial [Desulfobacterales bacterium]|nr:type VI secretion system ATPase TssH [Desulfobacterales bacterium]